MARGSQQQTHFFALSLFLSFCKTLCPTPSSYVWEVIFLLWQDSTLIKKKASSRTTYEESANLFYARHRVVLVMFSREKKLGRKRARKEELCVVLCCPDPVRRYRFYAQFALETSAVMID